ncbi:MAG TPA: PQQ-binding-like beta-propeller repeat protein [Gammaproteobacteria bacterium]
MKALLLTASLAASLAGAPVFAASGQLIWDDVYDPMTGDASASQVAVAGGFAYVAGGGPYKVTPSSDADIRVRAYDVASGALRWEDVWDAGGIHQDDEVSGLAVGGTRLFLAGSSGTNTAGSNGYVVRAYDRRDGTVLWEDHCGQFGSRARAIVADGGSVFAAGTCSPGTGGAGLLRAYAASTGAQRWEVDDVALPLALAVSGGTVLVAGADDGGHLVLRAYTTRQGRFLWEARPAEAQGLSLRTAELVVGDGKVYLAWWAVDSNSQDTNQVAAYGLRKGRLRWQADPGDRVNRLALDSNRLFTAEAGSQVLVSAYAASDGALLWQDQPGTPSAPYTALAVTVGDKRVFVAGQAFDPAVESAPHFMVRAYTRTGRLLWEDATPTDTMLGAQAQGLGWTRGVLVAAGIDSNSVPPFGFTHWLVRAYATEDRGR